MHDTDPRGDPDDLQAEIDSLENLDADSLDPDLLDLSPDAISTDLETPESQPTAASPPPVNPVDHADSAPLKTPATEKPRGNRRLLPLAVGAAMLIILPLGWLGWAFLQDRAELEAIEGELRSARDATERTSDAPEDGPERQQAQQLVARIGAIDSAEWWDRVVARLVAADQISRLKSEAAELSGQLSRRSANRAWWRERLATLDAQLKAEDLTLAQVDALKDELASPALPNPLDGGVGSAAVLEVKTRLEGDHAALSQQQARALAALQQAEATAESALEVSALDAAQGQADAMKAVDRRPPELAQAREAVRRSFLSARQTLEVRDALRSDLNEMGMLLQNFDIESGEYATLEVLSRRCDEIRLPESDPRFASCLELLTVARETLASKLQAVQARDEVLVWIANWTNVVNQAPDLESLVASLESLSTVAPPDSDLQTVLSAWADLEARIRSRTEELVIEKAEREASLARAAACAARLEAFALALETGDLSVAASELDAVVPETDEQRAQVDVLRSAFDGVLNEWLAEVLTHTEEASETANQLRACLANDAVPRIAPTFAAKAAESLPLVLTREDKSLYDELRLLAGAPAHEFEPVAMWYLDPKRTRGDAAAMSTQIEAALAAMKQPPVTLQVEGIEWNSVPCNWSRPQTDVTVAIGDEVRAYRLGQVVPHSTSLLTMSDPFEQRFTLPRETMLTLSVRGNFGCDDAASRFRGAGEITIDELRAGGRFSLPFHNGGDDRTNPHKLVFVAFPDEEVRCALQLPDWKAATAASRD